MNGWPAGTPIPNTVFEVYNARTNRLVDTIKTDKNGLAVSKPLPLARYKIVESKAAEFYGLDKTPIEVEIEHAGQIVKAAMTNKSLYTNVSIKKTGYVEVMPGQLVRYSFTGIANNSTTALESFYWRDTLPVKAVRLEKIYTGTWNTPGNYKIVYRTNLSGDTWRTLADNLSTSKNYVLDASPAALGLAANEYVTEFMAAFGIVPSNFRQVEAPRVDCKALSKLTGGTQFVNTSDAGGVYNGQWIMATSRWVTRVYAPSKPPASHRLLRTNNGCRSARGGIHILRRLRFLEIQKNDYSDIDASASDHPLLHLGARCGRGCRGSGGADVDGGGQADQERGGEGGVPCIGYDPRHRILCETWRRVL